MDDPLEILARRDAPGGASASTISARPEMMFSGVPTSWAMPEASLPATASVSGAAQLLLEIQRVLALRHHALPGLFETLRHAVEGPGQVAKLVASLHGQRRAAPAFAEGADRAGQVRHGRST